MSSERFNNILVGVKNITDAVPALRYISSIANTLKPAITLLTVIRTVSERQEAENAFRSAREIFPGLEVNTKIRKNAKPAQAIMAEMESGGYDLLVVGRIGKSILSALATSSLTDCMAESTQKALLVVKGERDQLRNLLICTSGNEIAEPVIRNGARLAQTVQARVTLLHVASPVPSMYTGMDEIEETLDELLQTDTPLAQHLRWCAELLDRYDLDAEIELRHGVVANEILREAQLDAYDLIVIGAHIISSPWKELMMDNVAHQVIERAQCPVLMVCGGVYSEPKSSTGNEKDHLQSR